MIFVLSVVGKIGHYGRIGDSIIEKSWQASDSRAQEYTIEEGTIGGTRQKERQRLVLVQTSGKKKP